ncbi:cytochrome P450 [Streptomyces erythrochromogenes]|uniref:Cytochrome P450 n=1 Tax=Streptomyces erythrochromogenes TaxID=285574 RepID=A0ABZ1Q853_9ACTN|nr:cytochrome P450 [Streptomyces erythrochromogenes]MCX5581994.1 cytochrome P450 [Streptomyces erythrochromogenes]
MTTTSTPLDKWEMHPRHFWLRGIRPEAPVEYDPEVGMWHVYGYPETLEILSDPATYSSEVAARYVSPEQAAVAFDGNLTQADPPEHQKLRKLVGRTFTLKMVAELESRIAALTHELLDRIEGDTFDLAEALAYPLPVIVICDMLGIPREDRELLKEWADQSLMASTQLTTHQGDKAQEESLDTQAEAAMAMGFYILELVTRRRAEPQDDLLSRLVEAEVDGERLTDRQIVNFANLLISAGHITTTMLLGNTILCLDAFPDVDRRVREDRSLVPTLLEESLRYLSPLAAGYRVTTRDVEIGGVKIPEGDVLEVWFSAANRDARVFQDPDVFDPARTPNPQIGFGRGIHFCLGAPLARLEGRVAMNILFDRFPRLRVDPDDKPTFLTSPEFTGVWRLPIRVN